MFTKTMLAATLALGVLGAPAFAQTTNSTMGGGMQSGSMAGGSMGDGMTNGTDSMAPKMTKMQMASMKKCQAMPSAKMMKKKTCMKMQKMHPDMASPGM